MRKLLEVEVSNLKPTLIDYITQISDEALDSVYGYGLSTDVKSFGYQANRLSAIYALHEFFNSDENDIDFVESIASAIHDGWSYAAYHINDSRYLAQPQKKVNRTMLADTPYSNLSEQEKEKDRVVSRAIIDALKEYQESTN